MADILTAEQHFARHDVVVRKLIGILDHIHEREEDCRAAYASLAVNMNPCVFRQLLIDSQEFIDIGRSRCRIVHDRYAVVLDPHRFDKLLFRLHRVDVLHLL